MRGVFSAIYWTFTLGIGASVAYSVTEQGLSDPPGTAAAPAPVDGEGCMAGFQRLKADLTGQMKVAVAPSPEQDGVSQWRAWRAWSDGWLVELADHRRACGTEQAVELATRLRRLHLAYTTALQGFSAVGEKARHAVEAAIVGEAPSAP